MTYFKPERVMRLERSPSTNDAVFEALAKDQSPCFIWTTYQTAGRGSRGREWVSPRHSVLCLTVGLTCEMGPHPANFCYPLFAGIWLHRALQQLYPTAYLRLKWPNDVLLQNRKLAGILCESQMNGSEIKIAVGVGINLRKHSAMEALPKGYAHLDLLPDAHIPEELVAKLSASWGPCLRDCVENDMGRYWMSLHNILPGERVRAVIGDAVYEGFYRGVRPDGTYIIEEPEGLRHLNQNCDSLERIDTDK